MANLTSTWTTSGRPGRVTRARLAATLLALVALLVGPSTAAEASTGGEQHHAPHLGRHHGDDTGHRRQLARVRRATVAYRDIDEAIADGYVLGYNGMVTGCIAHQGTPSAGAMGFHYFNPDLMEDPEVDPLRPEGLVYEPTRNGRLRLVAVEWVVPGEVWAETGNTEPPVVLGQDLHVLNPALGWYIHHAWIWKHNPSGVFADWNPRVTCPSP